MRKLPLIDRLRVGTACDVGWDNMADLGRDRHCARCDLVVHDVSSMTRAEVEALLEGRERGERLCLHRVVREADGAVLVSDGYIERPRRAPPSRIVAAAVATATAMTACSPASPPQAPQVEVAIAPMSIPAPIERTPPAPAAIESARTTEPVTPSTPSPIDPAPTTAPITAPVTPANLPPAKPAKALKAGHPAAALKPAHKPPKTVPPRHIRIDGDVDW